MSIKSKLEKLVDSCGDKAVGYLSGIEDMEKEISECHQAILAEFERMLPSEVPLSYDGNDDKWIGYNQAIQDIKAKLHSEGL